ncbi:MAG: hypothetical protein QXU15_03930, partial [Candidatus Aenigmatarchaeota archaeon]
TLTSTGLKIGGGDASYALDVVGSAAIDSPTFFVDAANDRVGIGTTAPVKKLDVVGDINATGTVYLGGVEAQKRVTGTCTGGAIRAINADGSVSCEDTEEETHASEHVGTGLSNPSGDLLAVVYGSTAGTAAEGNKQISINAGTGLTGGGTVTIGAGGSVSLSIDTSIVPRKNVAETISAAWTFGEDVTFQKNIRVAGNITYVNYDVLNVNGTIKPPLDNWFDIGSSSNRWRYGYFGSNVYVAGNAVLTTATNFGGDVSGTYNNLQLGAGVVGTNELADNAVTSAKIADGTITNADISATAGIAWSKLSGYPSINAGAGLTGGGTLDTSRTLSVAFGENFLGWGNLTNYPSACPAGYAVQAIGDTLTCIPINATQGVVNGSGTANYIPIWTSSSTLGNSIIYQLNNLIGIGSTSPSYLLEVGKTASGKDVNLSSTLYVNGTSGNVGIGTTAPGAKLHIEGGKTGIKSTDFSYGQLQVGNPNVDEASIAFIAGLTSFGSPPGLASGGYAWVIGPDVWGIGVDKFGIGRLKQADGSTGYRWYLTEAGNMYVSGNVGIGTTTPTAKLHVYLDSTVSNPHLRLQETGSGDYARLQFDTSGNSNFWHIAGMTDATHANSRLNFYYNGVGNIMSITGEGNVGIGTTAPGAKLEISGSNPLLRFSAGTNPYIQSDYPFYFLTTGNAAQGIKIGNLVVWDSYANNAPTNGAIIQGNVGIGTTAPAYKLDVAGDVRSTGSVRVDRVTPNSVTGVFASGDNLLTMTPYVDNALGFRTPYKVEKWDGTTWVDITTAAAWGVLTDGKPSTSLALINYNYTTDNTRIRLYYDFGSNWVTPAQQLVLYLQHTPTVNYLKVEQADDSAFTTNVETLKEITSAFSCGDCTRIIPTFGFYRRYLRIEIEVSRPVGSTYSLILREIAYYSPAIWAGSRLLSSMIPIDWDHNKNVFFTGNVGIGTTSPGSKLHVQDGDIRIGVESGGRRGIIFNEGTTADVMRIVYNGTESGDINRIDIMRGAGLGAVKELVSIQAGGNVGIGTTTPAYKLDVAGDIRATGTIYGALSGTADNAKACNADGICETNDIALASGGQIDFYDETGDKAYWYSNTYGTGIESGTLTDWSNSRFRWRIGGTSVSSGTEKMTLTSTGLKIGGGDASYALDVVGSAAIDSPTFFVDAANDRVGIGTTAPSQKLEVIGNIKATGSTPLMWVGSGGRNYQIENYDNRLILADAGVRRVFEYDPSGWLNLAAGTNIYISSGGNVGIGTTAPAGKLDVTGTSIIRRGEGIQDKIVLAAGDPNVGLELRSETSGGTPFIDFANDASTDFDARIRLTGNGLLAIEGANVGIGTTSPSSKLEVYGGDIEINNGEATGSYKIKGLRIFYAGDETEVSTTSTQYVLKKHFTAIFDSQYGIKPSYVNVIARLKNTGGYTTSLNITMEGCTGITLTTTSTSYTLVKGTLNTNCGDGIYPTKIYLMTSNSAGTAYNDIIEFYYVE